MLHRPYPLATPILLMQNLLAPQISQHAMRWSFLIQSMNWKSISRSSARISRSAIHLDGGGANARVGPVCTASLVISFAFQVRSILSYSHSSVYPFLGSAVAVERIFSSGRDTISICRASLQPDTIRTLMVLKHHIHRTRGGNAISLD